MIKAAFPNPGRNTTRAAEILQHIRVEKTTQAAELSGWSVTFQVLRMEPEVQYTAQSIQPLEFLTQIN